VTNREDPEDLLKVYAIERQDDSTALVLAFSMATAAFTYMIAALVFIDGHHAATAQILLAPLVPTAVACFLTLNTDATLLRSVHLQHLEACLHQSVPSANFHTDSGIVWRAAQIDFKNLRTLWKRPHLRLAFTVITIAAYGIIYLAMAGFTAYMIDYAPTTIWTYVAAISYGLVFIALAGAVLGPLKDPRFRSNPLTEETCPTCGRGYVMTDLRSPKPPSSIHTGAEKSQGPANP
jgi:hypothetical protein